MSNKTEDNRNITRQHENSLDVSFWEAHWKSQNTGWDIGHASPPITEYMDQFENKRASILIPGCGNAYEAGYLANNNFTDITVLDISPTAVKRVKSKFSETSHVAVLNQDFFQHQDSYDLIIEQTFFCAIPPNRRKEYAAKAYSLLNKGGKIAGVLFGRNFDREGPPFGGDRREYEEIFRPYFTIETMEPCYNSIPPRAGSELFIQLKKR